MQRNARQRLRKNGLGSDSNVLGYVVDPLYGKLRILKIGDAGRGQHAFLVKGKAFGPDWREESELISIHLTKAGRKKGENVAQISLRRTQTHD